MVLNEDMSQENEVASGEQVAVAGENDDIQIPKTHYRIKSRATESGTENEYKMVLLMFLRAQRLTKEFAIGANVDEAGGFDDVDIYYKHENKTYRLLIQLKHKEDPEKKIQFDALRGRKGNFSLFKLLASIPKTLEGSNHVNFALFTNASFDVKLHNVEGVNPLTKEFLSTAGHRGLIHGVKITDDICDTLRNESKSEDFIKRLIICYQQAHVTDLDALIKHELLLQFHRIVPQGSELYGTLVHEVREWWKLNGKIDNLREDWPVWKNLFPRTVLLNHIRFGDGAITSLLSVIDHPRVHLVYKHADVQLRSLKLLQSLQRKNNIRFLFVKIDDILGSTVIKMWKEGWFDILAVDTYKVSESENEVKDLLKDLMNSKLEDGGKSLILVSDDPFLTETSEIEWKVEKDSCTLNQMDKISKDLIIKRLQELSKRENQILSRDVTGQLLSMFLLVEEDVEKSKLEGYHTVDEVPRALLADVNGNTPLILATVNQNMDMVELLLQLKSDTAARDVQGNSALMIACSQPNEGIVKLLLDFGAGTSGADVNGDTSLMLAVKSRCPGIVKLLLQRGADNSRRDVNGFSALDIARNRKYKEIVEIFQTNC